MFDLAGRSLFVAGHRGMVGSALVRRLASEPVTVLTADRAQLDLTDQPAVRAFIRAKRPDVVVIAAAKVGGIAANNDYPADFIATNLVIQSNLIDAAAAARTPKLLFLGSSCIYPRLAPQPITEDALLTGPLEATNQWYAIAKIAGLKLAEAYRHQHGLDFISAMPTNLYGPGDNYDLASSHVIPALLRKAHEAKTTGADTLTVWGSGTPRREFMHVDDLADALVFVLKHYSDAPHINIGTGSDVTIAEVAETIAQVVGFTGRLVFDPTKPDGTPRKLMDSSRLTALGWTPRISLVDGLAHAYAAMPK
ncbi:GDP-L-fucose synthase [Sandaracinobacteroides saxicola]|uniref:GDP-L-fucose synthase n=1 Tax=Sandaracinobacteroides saxicola TaxID=2759707 RepID=A0A7G5IMD3_9SPHN|nr:GDP-L-fucose synthase [Sandaracinobacteroides saxicola]